MELTVKLKGNSARGIWPNCRIEFNDKLLCDTNIAAEQALTFTADAKANNTLKITHYGKTNRHTVLSEGKIVEDLSIELLEIAVDGRAITSTILYMQPYYVDWPENILATNPPEFLTNNLYFGFNGTYVIDILGNNQQQLFNELWLDEHQAHSNLTTNRDGKEVFERFDGEVDVDIGFDLTIYDLEKIVSDE